MASGTQADTQPEVNEFVKDIFGSDDEDEGPKGSPSKASSSGGGASADTEVVDDSDDDDLFANNRKGHKQKKGRLLGKGKKKKILQRKVAEAEAEAPPVKAPVEAVAIPEVVMDSSKKRDKKKEKDKKLKKRKAEDDTKASKKRSKEKRLKRSQDSSSSAVGEKKDDASEGDAYDSGEEVVADQDDVKFLADEDDALLAGVVGEYGADEQNFDDEPGMPKKKKRGGGGGNSGGGGGGGGTRKPLDPFSETLATLKRPKKVEVSETDKQRIAMELLRRMDAACKKDDELFRQGQPALNKVGLLKKVEEMVSLTAMQGTLLDYDVLGVLSEWLMVKSDNTLPSHTVRVAVYKMLDKLPCQSEHLKRKTEGSKRTIGQTVITLLKHKDETRENKVLIKGLVEKWSRGIYGKQTDLRNSAGGGAGELMDVAHQYQERRNMNSYATQAAAAESASFDEVVKRTGGAEGGNVGRARAPYSSGFVYTVKPESKLGLGSKDSLAHDDSRLKVLKIVKESKRGSGTTGKKENPRAMDMAQTGRNKN